MYDDGWSRFVRSGQIEDYLAYKQESEERFTSRNGSEQAEEKTGEVRGLGYAGFCNGDRYHN